MNQSHFPHGWDEERVQRVIAHYDSLADEEMAAEDDAVFDAEGCTMMSVPNDLVPKVRALVARHQRSD
jgi:hypothetical protein